ADLDAGVAPAGQAALGPALPRLAHAQAGDVGHAPIHDHALAVVAREPAQRLVQARAVEAAHLDPALAEAAPERPAPDTQRAEPVVHHAHGNAFGGLRDQRLREAPADLVRMDDVALEVHAMPRGLDGLEPGRVVLARVAQQAHGVAVHERRAGGA